MHLTIEAIWGLPGQPETTLIVVGDTLTHDGTPWHLQDIPEGGEGEFQGDSPFVGPIRRIKGKIHATVRVHLDHTADLSDVASWIIPNANGAVTIPAARKEPAA